MGVSKSKQQRSEGTRVINNNDSKVPNNPPEFSEKDYETVTGDWKALKSDVERVGVVTFLR